MRVLLLALALAACGQTASAPDATPDAEPAMTSGLDLSGHLVAVGPEFRLDAIPEQNAVVLVYPAYDQTVSAPYAAPQATDTGVLLQSGDITLTLTPGACTHEGAVYPMRATVTTTNGRPADGCALVTWDRHLLELMPQIDACIAASPETNYVRYAGEHDGAVLVRLSGPTAEIDCRVSAGQAQITPRDGALAVAGDGEALFVRGSGGPNPGGECFEAPEVRGANGELLGWMLDPQGC
jgi:hypothetical protein